MMEANIQKIKLSSQADALKWQMIKDIARMEGRNIDVILDEALTDYIEKKQRMSPRSSVMEAYHSSHKKYQDLSQKNSVS